MRSLRLRQRRLQCESLEPRLLLASHPLIESGLTATYFDNADLTSPSLTRIDPFVNFEFGEDGPAPGISSDTFSGCWSGRVQALASEATTFYTISDDGVRLWVNNQLVINNWSNHLQTENASPAIPLVAGQWYDVKLEYYDNSGLSVIKLLWSSPSSAKAVVPSKRLAPAPGAAPTQGLLLETFNNLPGNTVGDLTSHTSFPSSPNTSQLLTTFEAPSNRGDQFGSRIRGYVIAPETGAYTFWIAGNGEAQLFLSNDRTLANKRLIARSPANDSVAARDWSRFGEQRSEPVKLLAGEIYYVEVLHKEASGDDNLAVGWELPNGLWERPIPQSRLLPLLPEVRLFSLISSTHEGSTAAAKVTVARDDDLGRDLTVRYYLGGTATEGIDYAATTGAVVIPRGQRSAEITISPLGEQITEGKETIVVMLAPSEDYVLGGASTTTSTVTMTDGIPAAAGTNLLNANPLTNYGFNGGQYATRQIVSVSGMPFPQALQVNTHTRPALVWDIQARWNNTSPIVQGNTLFASFWLRNADPTKAEAHVDIVFEMNGSPWTKSLSHVATVGSEWTKIDLPFAAAASYAVGGAALALRFGYLPQSVQIGGLSLVNYGTAVPVSALPQTALGYPGQEANAAWRAEAEARIDHLRKGPLQIAVKDSAGNLLEAAKVDVSLREHAFGFGSAIAANPVLNDTTINGSRYRGLVKSLFNKVVTENALKWPNWQNARQTGINLVNWLLNNGLDVRGHVLVWPNWQWLPGSVKTTYDSKVTNEGRPAADAWLAQTVLDHISDEVTTLAGKLVEWDVINEPYANHQLMDILGNGAMVDWFKRAEQSDPAARMFINDYGILSSRGADYAHQDHYFNTIQSLLANGAPLEGIGMQSHFGSGLTGPERMLEILDRFSTFGVPLQATEFDIDVKDEQIQGDFTRDFMTTLFSHPQVNSILMWGFWQNSHWRPDAALFRSDWTVKPNGQVWMDLVHQSWTTDAVGTTLSNGRYGTRGYLGDYDIQVTYGNQSTTATATLTSSGTSIDVVFPGSLDFRPRNAAATAVSDDAVQLSWNAPSGAVTGYKIERQLPGMAWSEIGTVPSETTTFVDRGLDQDRIYNYRIRAYREATQSDYSEPLEVQTLPSVVVGTDGNDTVRLRASADGAILEVFVNAPVSQTPTYRYQLSEISGLIVDAKAGDDAIVVNFNGQASFANLSLEIRTGAGLNQLTVEGGSARIDARAADGGTLNTTVATDASLTSTQLLQDGLTLAADSRVDLLANSRVSELTLGTGAKLDIHDTALVIDYTGTSPVATLREKILSGRGGAGFSASWNGKGITSSAAAQANAIDPEAWSVGYAENGALPLGPYSMFRGVAVDDTAVLIAYARTGDANLDGVVDDNDVTIVGATYAPGVPQPHWALGDFDYNGFVDDDDVTLLGVFYEPAAVPPAAPLMKDEVRRMKDESVVAARSPDRAAGSTAGLLAFESSENFGPADVRGPETRAQQYALAGLDDEKPDDDDLVELLAESIAAESAARNSSLNDSHQVRQRKAPKSVEHWSK